MVDCLCHYFHLDNLDFSKELRQKLNMLTGRPSWFYDKFWQSFYVSILSKRWYESELKDMDKAQLFEMIETALNDGDSEQHADDLVRQAWDDKRETRSEAVSPSSLQMELYFAIKMNAGRVIITSGRGTLI